MMNNNCAICNLTQESGWAMGGFLYGYQGFSEPDFSDNWTITVICQPCSYGTQAKSMLASNQAMREYYYRLQLEEFNSHMSTTRKTQKVQPIPPY